MAGGKIDILVEPDTRGFPEKLGGKLRSAAGPLGTVAKGLGLAVAAGTAVAAVGLKKAIDIGIEYQSSLNELQAVSHATGEQMALVGDTAKRLGADMDLPATSAADAAAAMTELAKGGLSVDQAMTAAKGTLQLAAAAQVDAASAAEIQSQALNAFGLSADQAGHVADVLANSANAASGEITDFAQAMQQVGAVAHQFGLSIDETSTALSLFANAGIKGSDAGTLLKSALLALANPSKPAQKAIEQLGLKVYDAQGKFVGLKSLFEQLHTASEKMTDAQYQQATATVFGSDAVRLMRRRRGRDRGPVGPDGLRGQQIRWCRGRCCREDQGPRRRHRGFQEPARNDGDRHFRVDRAAARVRGAHGRGRGLEVRAGRVRRSR